MESYIWSKCRDLQPGEHLPARAMEAKTPWVFGEATVLEMK
jgi:hypothetical protein